MRYFYRDPLAAAWMAKNFGAKFICDYGAGEKILDRYHEIAICLIPPKVPNLKFYLHNESVHLIEPHYNDILSNNSSYAVWRHGDKSMEGVIFSIIQRNGIAFMWPEKEKIT